MYLRKDGMLLHRPVAEHEDAVCPLGLPVVWADGRRAGSSGTHGNGGVVATFPHHTVPRGRSLSLPVRMYTPATFSTW
eukprot:361875-Chlamydomonas_euryale.AAC.7